MKTPWKEPSNIIDEMFPDVIWTGESLTHRSLARYRIIPNSGTMLVNKLIAALLQTHWGLEVFELLQETFVGSEWLLSADEFEKLLIMEFYRHLHNQGDSNSSGKIKNPVTGSVFHRIALREAKVVCGIRFWVLLGPLGTYHLCFRFRVALLDEDVEALRCASRAEVAHTLTEHQTLVASLQVGEPTDEEVVSARQLLRGDTED